MSRYPCKGCNGHRSALCADCEVASREGLDHQWLVERYEELHSLPADSRKRAYIRGRIDEHCSQNAVGAEDQASARAEAIARIQTWGPRVRRKRSDDA